MSEHTSGQDGGEVFQEEKIPAGDCPNHGIVAGDAVAFNFPNPAECTICGEELKVAGLATNDELAEATKA